MIEQASTRSTAMARQALRGVLSCLPCALLRIIGRARQRRALAELDDRLLRDIGRTKEGARREASKPAWRR